MKRVASLAVAVWALLVASAPLVAALPEVSADLPDLRATDVDSLGADGVDFEAEADASADADADQDPGADASLVTFPKGDAQAVRPAGRAESVSPAAATATGAALGLGLLAILAFPFFSRIDSNHILNNDIRNRIHDAIDQNPGITIKEITKLVSIGWGTAVYHLARLESQRLVVSERHRQFRRFFRNGGGIVNDAKQAFSELKHPTTQRLASALLDRPGAAQKDLCEVLGISAPLAHKYLSRMEEAHLLTRQREWKTVKYFPTGRLAELVQGVVPPVTVPA